MKRVLLVLAAGFALLVVIAGVRTARYGSDEPAVERAPTIAPLDGAAERLAGAVRFATISHEDSAALDAASFKALHTYLAAQFPRVHSQLRREVVATHSVLYTWPGSDTSLAPMLLMGHLDVVPVEAGTESAWQEQPFAGRIANGFVWGRGSIDNKLSVLGTLEAAELLLSEGFRPARTVHLAYGHDEEIGGRRGARAIAELLKQRGVRLEMVLDEGGVIGQGLFPGVGKPVALVGVAEKGFVSVELTSRTTGGHSSLPPRESAVGILSAAVVRLEANQLRARVEGPTAQLFDAIGPQLPITQRAVFANQWLFRPMLLRKLAASPTTNAMVRTTTAVTMFQAGTKENVLASRARAVINFRIHPGDSIAGVLDHVRRVVDDSRVEVKRAGAFSEEPSRASRADSESFRRVQQAVRGVIPEAMVAPYLVVVATDARYYRDLTDNVFRFMPVRLAPEDLARMHGTNERVAIRDYEQAIRVYRQIIVSVARG